MGETIETLVPSVFDGIPVLNNMRAWFFNWKNERQPDDIDNLWNMFETAIRHADQPTDNTRSDFVKWYDIVAKQFLVGWNLTMGFYWARPFSYLNIDRVNRMFLLQDKVTAAIDLSNISNLKKLPDGVTYLALVDACKKAFKSDKNPFSSFANLSRAAWLSKEKSGPIIEEPISGNEKKFGERKYWLFAPGEVASKWDEFRSAGIMALSWDELGDLSAYKDREEIRAKMKSLGDKNKSYRSDSLKLWKFATEIQEGDIVYARKGRHGLVGRGVVDSGYIYDATRNEYRHIRRVKWTHQGYWEVPVQVDTMALTEISVYTDRIQKLEAIFTDEIEDALIDEEKKYPSYTEVNFLDDVFMAPERYQSLVELLKVKKNIILQGAPGVGKTYAAKRLAYSMIREEDTSRVMMIQFHQSYSYEDFIMGFRPTETGFLLTKGPFYEFCKTAEEDLERDYFFIIDEINRGNLSKIFGELLMLIEKDKRGEELRLLYSNERFSVPKNVYLIGLMNTADRSLAMIDYALRRRFAFYEMEPAFESEGFRAIQEQADDPRFGTLVKCVQALNEEISQDESLGAGFRIGHSYFCTQNEATDSSLYHIVEYELLPLLNEYWFDEKDKINEWTSKLRGVLND